MFVHMHYVRLVFVAEDAPEFARPMPRQERAGSAIASASRRCWARAPWRCVTP